MSLALCVGVAFLLLAGSAFAGTTALLGATPVNTVALQVGKATQNYTIPAGYSTLTRTLGVARQAVSGNFFMQVTLPAGFTFVATPAGTSVTLATAGGGAIVAPPTVFEGGIGASYIKFLVEVTDSFETAPVFNIATETWVVRDGSGALAGQNAATIQLTVQTFDANTNAEFDSGMNSANWMSSINALSASIVKTAATIDVSQPSGRKNFVLGVAPSTDTLTQDNDATVTVNWTIPGVVIHDAAGLVYAPVAGDTFKLTFSGDPVTGLDGISNFSYAPGLGGAVTDNVSAGEITSGTSVLSIAGNNANMVNGAAVQLRITVDNFKQLTTRSVNVAVSVEHAATFTGNNRGLVSATELTRWGINGTVLLANWANANNSYWKSRFYIWNPSQTGSANATVTIKVFQIPVPGSAAPIQIGQTYQLASAITAGTGMTIRLWEDVLNKMNPVPSETDLLGPDGSGNCAVEITVFARGVTGTTQTFKVTNDVFTGTVPMTIIQ